MLSKIVVLFRKKAPISDNTGLDRFGDGYTVGFVEGAKAGAEMERERIRRIFQFLPNPQHQTMLENYMFDGVTHAEEAAQRVIKASRLRASFTAK